MICYGKMPKTIFFRVKCKKKICYLEKYKNMIYYSKIQKLLWLNPKT